MSRDGIEIVSAASLIRSWSGFSGLKFHYVTVTPIKHHADVTGLTVVDIKRKKI